MYRRICARFRLPVQQNRASRAKTDLLCRLAQDLQTGRRHPSRRFQSNTSRAGQEHQCPVRIHNERAVGPLLNLPAPMGPCPLALPPVRSGHQIYIRRMERKPRFAGDLSFVGRADENVRTLPMLCQCHTGSPAPNRIPQLKFTPTPPRSSIHDSQFRLGQGVSRE